MQKKVLIIDDEIFSLKLMEKTLSSNNLDVQTVSESDKAIDIINSNRFDAIILDINMPKISGLELLKMKNLKVDGINVDTPTIMCSSSIDYDHISEAMQNHAHDYIVKPFHIDRLVEIIGEL